MTTQSLKMLIDGRWINGAENREMPVTNPFDGSVLGQLALAEIADLDHALKSAQAGFLIWKKKTAFERQVILEKAARLLEERAEDIASNLTREMGKPIREARMELAASIEVLRFYGEEGKRAYGRTIPARVPGMQHKVIREPIGPVIAFVAWNFPALNVMRKVAGALAAGCSIIIKPSEETPLTAIAIAKALTDAGLPAGVLNVVFGDADQISTHLCDSDIPRKLSFTGSVPVGKHLQKLAAEKMIRCTLELGGHAPFIVFNDADIEQAAKLLVAGKFRNAGQVCVSPSRFYVQREVYNDFLATTAKHAAKMQIGDGLCETTDMGPLIDNRRVVSMQAMLDDCLEQGGKLLWQGECPTGHRGFFAPTLVQDVPEASRIMNEEPFGPICPITPFDTTDKVIERANRLPFGLAVYAFTSNAKTAARLTNEIDAGMLAVNSLHVAAAETPFGGVRESGYGSEGGMEGLDTFLKTRSVTEIF